MKKVETKITCDTCDKDISPHITSLSGVYILRVQAVNIAEHHADRPIYASLIYPLINHDLYFCGLKCMTDYKANKQ